MAIRANIRLVVLALLLVAGLNGKRVGLRAMLNWVVSDERNRRHNIILQAHQLLLACHYTLARGHHPELLDLALQ